MWTVAAIAVLTALCVLGYVRLCRQLARQAETLDFIQEVEGNVSAFGESRGMDGAKYAWLLNRSTRLHAALGAQAILAEYRTPYGGPVYGNFPAVNLIQEIRKYFEQDAQSLSTFSPQLGPQATRLLLEVLMVRDGRLVDVMEETARAARNVVICFREGVAAVLLGPLLFLQGLDLLSADRVQRASRSLLFRLITAVIGVVGSGAMLIGLYVDLKSLGVFPDNVTAPSTPYAASPTTYAAPPSPTETPSAERASPRSPETSASP